LVDDLTPEIKKFHFDLGRLAPAAIQASQSYSGTGGMLFMPYYFQSIVLFYNKNIFDKFGVSYPKDGMTWEETIELVKRLSRTEGGQLYRGLDFPIPSIVGNSQLSLAVTDPKTNKAVINTDGWKHWFNVIKGVYEVPGNELEAKLVNKQNDYFMKDQTLAMLISVDSTIPELITSEPAGLNWDMVTMPTFREAKDTGMMVNAPYYAITPTSVHKDQAFQAIGELLSDQAQLNSSRNGRLTVLNNPDINKELGSGLPALKGKNIAALYKLKFADHAVGTPYDKFALNSAVKSFRDVIINHKDVNTALREAEEEANATIQAQVGK
jgi:multiple sugar transport system substrate-binding protein